MLADDILPETGALQKRFTSSKGKRAGALVWNERSFNSSDTPAGWIDPRLGARERDVLARASQDSDGSRVFGSRVSITVDIFEHAILPLVCDDRHGHGAKWILKLATTSHAMRRYVRRHAVERRIALEKGRAPKSFPCPVAITYCVRAEPLPAGYRPNLRLEYRGLDDRDLRALLRLNEERARAAAAKASLTITPLSELLLHDGVTLPELLGLRAHSGIPALTEVTMRPYSARPSAPFQFARQVALGMPAQFCLEIPYTAAYFRYVHEGDRAATYAQEMLQKIALLADSVAPMALHDVTRICITGGEGALNISKAVLDTWLNARGRSPPRPDEFLPCLFRSVNTLQLCVVDLLYMAHATEGESHTAILAAMPLLHTLVVTTIDPVPIQISKPGYSAELRHVLQTLPGNIRHLSAGARFLDYATATAPIDLDQLRMLDGGSVRRRHLLHAAMLPDRHSLDAAWAAERPWVAHLRQTQPQIPVTFDSPLSPYCHHATLKFAHPIRLTIIGASIYSTQLHVGTLNAPSAYFAIDHPIVAPDGRCRHYAYRAPSNVGDPEQYLLDMHMWPWFACVRGS